jgi:membrane-bound ClpP family serine protease
LIVAGAVAVVLELPALGGLLVVVGIAAFVWDSVSLRPLHQRFRSKAQPGRFRQRL